MVNDQLPRHCAIPENLEKNVTRIVEYFQTIPERGQAELRHCRSLQDGFLTRWVAEASAIGAWPEGQDEGLAAALILLAWTRGENSKQGFISRWAYHAKRLADKPHINELRFVRWTRASDWIAFLEYGLPGVKLLMQKDHRVDLVDLCRACLLRAEGWASDDLDNTFVFLLSNEFFSEQVK